MRFVRSASKVVAGVGVGVIHKVFALGSLNILLNYDQCDHQLLGISGCGVIKTVVLGLNCRGCHTHKMT